MSHDDLRALAAAATPGPWEVESYWDSLMGPEGENATWRIPGLERWHGLPNTVHFGRDEATARYVAAVSPDVVVGLLDEIKEERANYAGAMADLDALVDVTRLVVKEIRAVVPNDRLASRIAGDLERFLAANHPEPEPSAVIVSGDMAVELPASPNQVVDLMAALEKSVAAAKEARRRHPQPRVEQ